MPIYAYKCASCGHAKDVLQKISDDPLTVCPSCNAATFNKQLTAAGFQLKGSGWYVTDFRDGAKTGETKSDDTKAGVTDSKPVESGASTTAPVPGGDAASTKSVAAPAPAATPTPSPVAPTGNT